MSFRGFVSTLVPASLVIVSSLCVAQQQSPDVNADGLQHVRDSNLALVYAQPGIDLGIYKRIYLDDAYIAFKKNWQRDRKRSNSDKISADDMDKIRLELSLLFRDVFSGTLEAGGYELVTERAADVLLIRPAIINLDVIAPATAQGNDVRTFSESAGEMTLYLELCDSLTDDLIAKALDRKIDRKTGYFKWQNRVTNRAAANRILTVWADVLKEGLDHAMGPSTR